MLEIQHKSYIRIDPEKIKASGVLALSDFGVTSLFVQVKIVNETAKAILSYIRKDQNNNNNAENNGVSAAELREAFNSLALS